MSPLKNRFFDSKIVLNLTTIVTVVVIWYFVAQANFFPAIFLPTPKATFGSLWALIVSGKFFHALLISSLRIIGATILAVIIGAVVGVLMGMSKKIEALLMPITQPIRYLPITALLPLFILWFGIGEAMKVMFLFVGIVFYFIPLVANAIRTTPLEYIEVARGLGATENQIMKKVYWPHALPQILDGLIVINGIGWTYVILAEIVNARNGLGYLINIAGRLQRSDEVFAGLILIALVAVASDKMLRFIKDKYFFW
ncbi:MAG: hypothetical protein A2538_01620 [Candidatus Magasanikbacteria bacterium RIFOXYD2_FULL_41_14]|uniref:ABC transmembrane type-1 domain-containing protein n=1 Tax=Candidatus Magasanikbacteria bacterium RIFOXYD2_FULL_41_14 TaxID=1798709 RepID=A0A1F6PDH4_9BACT|nr:MAG: hypothetical protein A2538_01620 [Candidatus Magasanikbacteria bacterium RIFOXYD2_FULL_41_14]